MPSSRAGFVRYIREPREPFCGRPQARGGNPHLPAERDAV